MTIHPIPKTFFKIGYLPKSAFPDTQTIAKIRQFAKDHNCIFVKFEPNILSTDFPEKERLNWLKSTGLQSSRQPLFPKHTFYIDLRQSEESLLAKMKPKTRYNIGLAQRKGVSVIESREKADFEAYLQLSKQTWKRQGFYSHNSHYHRLMWQVLQKEGLAKLLVAKYQGKVIAAWLLFVFGKSLYYPYGASATEHKNLMASSLLLWEAIRWGKKHGLTTFDLWGSLGANPNPKDSWYGFHHFKQGFNPELIEFIGSYDLVINPLLYKLYGLVHKLRELWLKI